MTAAESRVLDLAVAYRRAYTNFLMLRDTWSVQRLREELNAAADALLAERRAVEPPVPYAALEPEPDREPIHLDQEARS